MLAAQTNVFFTDSAHSLGWPTTVDMTLSTNSVHVVLIQH